ncbi:MAG: sulfite reductase subunit A [Ignavibacteria bacterium]|nr:sulfite reductase subunit A [Ignavibacteria bacterium]
MYKIEIKEIDALFELLRGDGYNLIGPVLKDGAVIYDEIESSSDLPIGWTDEQEPGKYRINKSGRNTLFEFTCGPQSWKKFLFPTVQKLFEINKEEKNLFFKPIDEPPKKYAFIGVRACELNAIQIQDKIFTQGEFIDHSYKKRRENLFIIAVNCTSSKGTCFCTSMNAGPKVNNGYDISLTEVYQDYSHYFISHIGSEIGKKFIEKINPSTPNEKEIQTAESLIQTTAAQMERKIDVSKIEDILFENFEHPRWDEVAERCMSCANCTMVCPTCFCTTVEDITDLTGTKAERIRKWDSCFTLDFSYIHGGSIRNSTKSRYRQWLTHKFASWHKQFESSGCVGCGRCITWCPVGIDITAEINAIRETKNIKQVLIEENQ